MPEGRVVLTLLLSAMLLVAGFLSCKRNLPPDVPPTPGGPANPVVGDSAQYVTSTSDPDGDDVTYQFDWGDGTQSGWSSPVASGEAVTMSKAWPTQSTFSVRSRARDLEEATSEWSNEFRVTTVPNYAPSMPAITGPQSGWVNVSYTYSLGTSDPNLDSVSLQVDWGDGDVSAWSTFVPSGGLVSMAKSWTTARNYYAVKARAKDRREATSGWTPEYPVAIMPNDPPNTPSAPNGPDSGHIGHCGRYSVWVTDPDHDSVSCQFNWGRGESDTSAWDHPRVSGDYHTDSVIWTAGGTILVKARARDTKGGVSDWSPPCTTVVEMADARWRYRTGGDVVSSPAIGSDGTVYVGSGDNYLYAINPDSTLRWCYETRGSVYSSPAIGSDGTVYFGSRDSFFYALNPNGTLKWNYPTGSVASSSPAIGSDGTIYVGSSDSSLYALNPDGSLKWRYPTGGYIASSPAVGPDGTIHFESWDFYLYALNPGGTLKWRYPTGGDVFSSPAIGPDGTVYFGSNDSSLYALYPGGTLKWQYKAGGRITSSPTVGSDGTVYVGSHDHSLYAINSTGSLNWRYQTGDLVESSPAIGLDGTVYVGSSDHFLYALQATGTLAHSAWPKFRHDIRNTGRVGGP